MADRTVQYEIKASDGFSSTFQKLQGAVASTTAGFASLQGMMAGLAGGAVVGGLATLVKHGLEQADAMNKMAQKTGVASAELSKLAYAANLSDVSNEQLTKGFKGLSEQMAKAADGSSYTAALFTKMGVDLKAGTGPALEKIADVFKSLPDGATKTALAVELFGKAGQDMIPLLNQGAAGMAAMKDEAEALGLVISGETAAAAEKFNDNMKAMATGAEKAGITLVTRLAASLASVSEAMKEAYKDSGLLMAAWVGLGGVAAKMFTDDSLSDIEKTQKRMGELRVEMQALKMQIEVANEVGDEMHKGMMAGLIADATRATQEYAGLNAELVKLIKNQNAAEEERKRVKKAADDKAEEFKHLKELEDARKKSAAEVAAWNKRLAAEDTKGWIAKSEAGIAEYEQGLGVMNKDTEDFYAQREKLMAADVKGLIASIDAEIEEYERGLTEIGRQTKSFHEEQDKIAAQSAHEQGRIYDDLASIGGRFFSDLVMHGKSAFDGLKQMLKSFAADLLAMFAKKYVLQMIAGATGMSIPGMATAGDFSSMVIGGSTLGGVGIAATLGALGGGLGAKALGANEHGQNVGAAAGAVGAAIGMAIAGPIGAAIGALGGAIIGKLSSHGGDKQGGSYGGTFDAMGNATGGSLGWYGVNSKDAAVANLVQTGGSSINSLIKTFGGTSSGFQIGLGYDADPQGTASSRLTSYLKDASGRQLYGQSGVDIGRGGEDASLKLEMSRILIEALKASDINSEVKKLFDGFQTAGATQEAIDALIASADDLNAALTTMATVTISGLTIDSLKQFQLAGESLNQTAARVTGAFASLQDLFSTDAEKMARDQQAIADAFAKINVAVPESNAGFKALIDSIDLSTEAGRALFEVLAATGPKFKELQDKMTGLVNGVADSLVTAYTTVISLNDLSGINIHTPGFGATEAGNSARSGLAAYLQGSLLGGGSPLDPMAQYREAKRQYDANLLAAQGGDANAISSFGGYRDAFLNASRAVYASSGQYNSDFFGSYNAGAALTGGAVGPYTVAAAQANTQSLLAGMAAQTGASIEALNAATEATTALLARIAENTAKPATPGALTPTTL